MSWPTLPLATRQFRYDPPGSANRCSQAHYSAMCRKDERSCHCCAGFYLRLYRRVHRIDAEVDDLPQILSLEVVIILCARLRTLDDAPSVNDLFCGTGRHETAGAIFSRVTTSSWATTTYFCGCQSGTTLSPEIGPLVTSAAI
jgi:hypothetical protein